MSRSLTQLDVEAGTNISNCRLSFLENGRRSPTDKELEALAKFYGVSVESISGEVEVEFESGVIA